MRFLRFLVIYSHFIQDIAYTKKTKFLLYDLCDFLFYFKNIKLNKNDKIYKNVIKVYY